MHEGIDRYLRIRCINQQQRSCENHKRFLEYHQGRLAFSASKLLETLGDLVTDTRRNRYLSIMDICLRTHQDEGINIAELFRCARRVDF